MGFDIIGEVVERQKSLKLVAVGVGSFRVKDNIQRLAVRV